MSGKYPEFRKVDGLIRRAYDKKSPDEGTMKYLNRFLIECLKKDPIKGFQLLKHYNERTHEEHGNFRLAMCYKNGTGGCYDIIKAVRHYRLAIERHSGPDEICRTWAMCDLAQLYERGYIGQEHGKEVVFNVPKKEYINRVEACKLYKLAVDTNQLKRACVCLAKYYEVGCEGVVACNFEEAVKCFKRATEVDKSEKYIYQYVTEAARFCRRFAKSKSDENDEYKKKLNCVCDLSAHLVDNHFDELFNALNAYELTSIADCFIKAGDTERANKVKGVLKPHMFLYCYKCDCYGHSASFCPDDEQDP